MPESKNLHIILFVAALFFSTALSQVENYQNDTALIECGGALFQNTNHTRFFYRAPTNTNVTLPACQPLLSNESIYWMLHADLCRLNRTFRSYFAVIDAQSTTRCGANANVNISNSSCQRDYSFTRQSMTIRNLSERTSGAYICFVGQAWNEMVNTSAVTINITIEDSTTTEATETTHTTVLPVATTGEVTAMLSSSYYVPTITTIPVRVPEKTNSILKIILPSILVPLTFIIIVVICLLIWRRKKRRKKESDYFQIRQARSKRNLTRSAPDEPVYSGNVTSMNADHGYAVWRPVQQKF